MGIFLSKNHEISGARNHVLDPHRCSKVSNSGFNGLKSSKLAVAAVKGERVGMSDQLGDLRRLLSDFSSGGGFDMQNSAMGMSFAPELMTTPADEKHATLPVVEEKKNPPLEATLRKRIKRANFMPGQTQAIVKMVTRMEEQQIVKKQRWETKKMRILEESRKTHQQMCTRGGSKPPKILAFGTIWRQ